MLLWSLVIKFVFLEMTTISIAMVNNVADMILRGMEYDLCELICIHFLKNLKEIRKNKKNTFWYGNLVVCLLFYFLKELPVIGRLEWSNIEPIVYKIRNFMINLGSLDAQEFPLLHSLEHFR